MQTTSVVPYVDAVRLSKTERLAEFFRRLGATAAACSAEGAFHLVETVLTEVEDELTNVPADPERWMTDGRLYPPQEDSRRQVPGFDGVVRYRSRAHNTYIAANGAIEIQDLTKQVLFRKEGADGKHVWDR